jgi:hypothetical protein
MKTTHRSLTGPALLLGLVPWTAVCIRADEAEDKAVKAIQKPGGRINRADVCGDDQVGGALLERQAVFRAVVFSALAPSASEHGWLACHRYE